ncbi:hypothetical protein CVV65_11095 [Kyrpidia spormannii]|uniref:Uncharacterized protein n=2 Tax=Kyrpidia spormannii TaxID=2055160 RepID=A0A2K8N8G7_9BACL|nr:MULTISPECIES: hypothetical protein [Kyrpidia]ATY85405.1 hypothetical protein CVV65_11095 [Kyrpidia spormannii]MCL6575389.1 hypothetical protein [Kyrpidia sp.]CAB3393441.1 conserved protein of unknown function [Kyrpidia spormannii]CAB3394362.1 conserved protein of unknown function [Kyrpidia spormannii]
MTTGFQLVHKWIERNRGLGKTDEEMMKVQFVYGDTLYRLRKTDNGEIAVDAEPGTVIIFRDERELEDELTCRICGARYTNKIDTIRCCMNGDE